MTCTIQVRVDEDLKVKSDALFKDLGTDTTSAIRMFLTRAIAENGFPFPIKKHEINPYVSLTEQQFLQKLDTSKEHADQGLLKDANDVILDMRNKYGL